MPRFSRHIVWWCALGVLASSAPAGSPYHLRFERAPGLSENRWRDAAGRLLELLPPSAAADSLGELLAAEGYLDARVTWTADTLTVVSGPRAILRTVILSGELQDTLPRNGPFTSSHVDAVVDSLLWSLDSSGYYFARLRVERAERDSAGVVLRVGVVRGPAVRVAARRYHGLERTRMSVLDRYLPPVDEQLLSSRLLRQIERALRRIPFVSFQPPVGVRPRPGLTEADLVVNLRELPPVQVSGAGGYVPDDGVGLVWQLQARLTNLFGGGREVRLRSARVQSGRSQLALAFRQPVFLLGPDIWSLDIASRDYRDDFSEFQVTGAYRAEPTPHLNTSLELSWARIQPALGNGYARFMARFAFAHTGLDDTLNPSRGFRTEAGIAFAYRRPFSTGRDEPGAGVFTETRDRVSIEFMQPLAGPLVGRLGIGWLGYESGDSLPPLSELYYLGGPGSLRGYRNEQFAVRRAGLVGAELRWRFAEGYFFVFYDGAYLNRPVAADADGAVSTEQLYRDSYGGGFRLLGGRQVVTVSFGWHRGAPLDQPRMAIALSSGL